MLTLVLAMALCTPDGPRICSYIDATAPLNVTSDAMCHQVALEANSYNRSKGEPARFQCVSPQRYAELSGEQPSGNPPIASF